MSPSLLNTSIYQYSLVILGCLTEIIICIIFVIESYHIIIHRTKLRATHNTLKVSKLMPVYYALPLFIYTFYIILGITDIFTWLRISQNCPIVHFIGGISYILSKGALYSYFILRLYVMYTTTIFAYNPKCIIALFVSIIIHITITLTLITTNYSVSLKDQSIIFVCDEQLPFYIHVYVALMDQIITFTAVYLFTKPLIQILKFERGHNVQNMEHSSQSDDEEQNTTTNECESTGVDYEKEKSEEYVTIIKVAALSFISSITTFMVLSFQVIAFRNYMTFLLDMLINSMCIFLMNSNCNVLYGYICCLTNRICEECILWICCLQQDNVQREVGLNNIRIEGQYMQRDHTTESNL